MADCQAVVDIKNDLIRTMGECRDVTDQYQTGRSAYLRLLDIAKTAFQKQLTSKSTVF